MTKTYSELKEEIFESTSEERRIARKYINEFIEIFNDYNFDYDPKFKLSGNSDKESLYIAGTIQIEGTKPEQGQNVVKALMDIDQKFPEVTDAQLDDPSEPHQKPIKELLVYDFIIEIDFSE